MRTLITCPGIGDFLWLAMKLQHTGERFNVRMSEATPQRGGQLKDLLPHIIASHEYRGMIPYRKVNNNNIQNFKNRWSQIDEQEFYLSANSWLEEGKRIEGWLEDLPVSFMLDYHTTDEDKLDADKLLPQMHKYIGIYCSAYSNGRNWGFWDAKGWFTLVKLLHGQRKDLVFVVIGAEYDTDQSQQLIDLMKEAGISYVDTVGEPLPVVIEIMRRLHYAFYFPSGLAMLSETCGGSDSTMFYPQHRLPNMPGTWADPERIKSGAFKECFFCSPEQIYEWVRDEYCIYDKLK